MWVYFTIYEFAVDELCLLVSLIGVCLICFVFFCVLACLLCLLFCFDVYCFFSLLGCLFNCVCLDVVFETDFCWVMFICFCGFDCVGFVGFCFALIGFLAYLWVLFVVLELRCFLVGVLMHCLFRFVWGLVVWFGVCVFRVLGLLLWRFCVWVWLIWCICYLLLV